MDQNSNTNDNNKSQELKKHGIFLVLLSMIFILLATNIALLIYNQGQQKKWNQWQIEKRQHQENIKAMAAAAIAEWQAEFALYESLEKAWENYFHNNLSQASSILKDLEVKGNPTIFYWKGLIYYKLAQPELALKEWNNYLQLLPNSIYGHWYRAQTYSQLKQTAKFQEDLENLLQIEPNFIPAKEILEKIIKKE